MKIRKTLIAALTLLATGAAVLIAVQPARSAHTAGVPADLLPDLQTLIPTDFSIEVIRRGPSSIRRLRFSNEVVNAHTGVLELYPASEDCDGDGKTGNDRMAKQRIYADSNSNGFFERGADTAFRIVDAGCMVLHPRHRHWHFDDFARYELRTLPGAAGSIVASSSKVTFCIADVHRTDPALPGSPENAYYTSCDRESTQGLSVGWSDEYPAYVQGQHVDITGVADGSYCLVSTANPVNKIEENDNANNQAAISITLNGTNLPEVNGPC